MSPPRNNGQLRPAVVLIHGGGWRSFDKSTMRGMGGVLARAGYVAFFVAVLQSLPEIKAIRAFQRFETAQSYFNSTSTISPGSVPTFASV